MAVEFHTVDFEFSHGRKPRGIGAWAFSFVRNPDMSEIVWINGSYGLAKQIMTAEARKEGVHSVFVQP